MQIKITLIRHGLTKAIEKDLYCGLTDISISRKGIKEIAALKEKGVYPLGNDALFFTSELKRTLQTLELIYGQVPYVPIADLNEQDLGNLDMRSFKEIKDIALYKKWLIDTSGDIRCPGGESYNQFKLRIKLAFYKLLEQTKNQGKNAIVITHGSVISVVMSGIFYEGKKTFKEWQPTPGLGYVIYYNNGFHNYETL